MTRVDMLIRNIIIFCLSIILSSCTHSISEVKYKAFVINLDNATERMKLATNQLKEHNIQFQRFKAVNGYRINITDIDSGKKFTGQDLKDKKISLVKGKKYFVDCGIDKEANFIYFNEKNIMSSAGEFGCLCSHRGVLVEAIKQNLDVAVVFEDDFKILSNQFSFLLHTSINKIPENSVIYLDAHGSGLGNIQRDQNIPNLLIQLPKIPKLIFGTYALVFDIKAAKSIIQSIETDRQIDNTITKLIMKKKIKGFLLNKKTITFSEELGSNIKEMGRPH